MTRTGLYLGKFAPFHTGHQYCVDVALEECDEVLVIAYYTDVTDTSLRTRANWIRDIYDDEPVTVLEAWTGPDEHGYSEAIKRKHEQYVGSLLERHGYSIDAIDVFYSSEQYGSHMSGYLGAVDRRVDRSRTVEPISGTNIRQLGYWSYRDMIPDLVYMDLVDRVAIVGGVSSGKTTLARELADEHRTVWMPEHGREFWEEHADENGLLSEDELVQLAFQHTQREDEMAQDAGRYLFVDTTPLTTLAWAKYYHNSEPDELVQMAMASASIYDEHVLCDPDIPFEDEPGRDGRENRKRLHRMHVALMDDYNIDYTVVDGDVDERVRQVNALLDRDG